jgi:hypothetical protein
MILQTNADDGGKSLDRALLRKDLGEKREGALEEKEQVEIDMRMKEFLAYANHRGARDYYEKMPDYARNYVKKSEYWWQVEAAFHFQA